MHSDPMLAVDCGASHVAVARLVRSRGNPPVWTGLVAEPVAAADREEDTWLMATASALQTLGRRADVQGSCVLGLPGHLLQLHSFAIPHVAPANRRRLLRFEATQALPAGREALAWSAVVVGEDAGHQQIVITSVRVATLAALCRSAARAGFHPRALFPSWLVALDAAGARAGAPAAGVAVNIGARSTQVVVRTGTRCYIRNLGLGGDLVGQRLAEELGQPRTTVEAEGAGIWSGTRSGPPDAPAAMAAQLAAETLARRLSGEIGRLLGSVPHGDAEPRPASLRVSGGGALTAGLSQALADLLALSPVPASGPAPTPAGIDGNETRSPLDQSRVADAAALGACVRRHDTRTANLLPRRLLRELRLIRWWPLAATAAVLLAVGLWWPIGHYRWESRRLDREAAALSAKVAAIRARVAGEKAAQKRLDASKRRAATLRRLVAARTAWPAFLADLEARLARTGDVWLERLELEAPTDPARPAPKTAAGGRLRVRSKAPKTQAKATGPLRLRLSGCVFDPDHPLVTAGDGCRERVQTLWANLTASPYVVALADERLKAERAGILRFEVTLLVASQTLL